MLAIIHMAHSLKLDVIAEGVETAAQTMVLRRQGCDYIQGFHFSAPLPSGQLAQLLHDEQRSSPRAGAADRQRDTLLLVDDEPGPLTILRRVLQPDGYHILAARSAAEGFELLALYEVQVILCDQRMPVMNGTDFLGSVKELYPETTRILLSGHLDLDSVMQAINRGAIHRCYTKPWDDKQLRENVRLAFRDHRAALMPGAS